MTVSQGDKAARFRALHRGPGAFLIPNPWDAGSARILAGLGFQALATSSGACAGTLGKRDGKVTREEAPAKATMIAEVPSDRAVPVSVNRGTPAVISDPGSDFSKAMTSLAKSILPPESKKAQRKRLSLARA